VKQQEALVAAAEYQKKAADQDQAKIEDLIQKNLGSKFDLNKAKEMSNTAQSQVEAAQQKLQELKAVQPKLIDIKVARAQFDRDHKQELLKQATQLVKETQVVAPDKGTVLRVHVAVGDPLGSSPKMSAIEFCPDLPRIIRAEVPQEWASRLQVGQEAVIEDDITTSPQWQGKIIRVSKWFTHRRSILQEPFQFNDVRTLECLVAVTQSPANAPPLRIGQRMRVMIKQGGP
jgi:multidrug resistance efflux pump